MVKKTCCFAVLAVGLLMTGWAMPSRSELKKVQSTVNELMADDIAAMKGGKRAPADAAQKALEYAGVATDEASKFLLYKGAFGLFVQGGKYEEAIAALEALNANVKNVPDKVVADIVREKLKKISKKDGGAIFEYYARVDRRMRYGEERAKLEKQVKANPSDKDAQRSLAQAHVVLGDWSAALASFAALGGDEAKAAKSEQGGKFAEAADFWWGYSVAGDEDLQDEFRAHASSLYAQAIKDGKLGGLKKALAEKRMAEFAPKASSRVQDGAFEGNAQAQQTAGVDTSEKEELAPKNAESAPLKKYDWSIPANLKTTKLVELDMGEGVTMRFLSVTPGEALLRSKLFRQHKVKVTRPFWIAQFPVSKQQYERLLPPVDYRSDKDGRRKELRTRCKDIWPTCVLHIRDICRYEEAFRNEYGRLLPAGWTFRRPTEGECALCLSRKHLSFDRELFLKTLNDNGQRNLPHWETDEYSGLAAGLGCRPVEKALSGKVPYLGPTTLLADCISMPEFAKKLFFMDGSMIPVFEKAVNYQAFEVDPFRHTEEGEGLIGRFFSYGDGFMWDGSFMRGPCMVLTLVAGPDVVDEWRKKNRK